MVAWADHLHHIDWVAVAVVVVRLPVVVVGVAADQLPDHIFRLVAVGGSREAVGDILAVLVGYQVGFANYAFHSMNIAAAVAPDYLQRRFRRPTLLCPRNLMQNIDVSTCRSTRRRSSNGFNLLVLCAVMV